MSASSSSGDKPFGSIVVIEAIYEFEILLPSNDPAGYDLKIVCVPPDMPTSDPRAHDYDARSITVGKACGSLWFNVLIAGTEQYVGHAIFAADEGALTCDSIDIAPAHRRRGIVSRLYDLAEAVFQAAVQPSFIQTDDAKSFWEKRLASAQILNSDRPHPSDQRK